MAGWIVGGPAAGAALVTFTSFFAALIYLFRLAREDLGEDKAGVAVQFLAFGPFAVYYSAIYAESLYLLGAVAAFYYFRRGAWVRASVWGLLVGLTRPNGCLLSAVLLVAIIDQAVRARRTRVAGVPRESRLIPSLFTAAMPTLGLGIYCVFVYFLTGDALHALRLHALWGRGESTFWGMVVAHYQSIHQLGFSGYVANDPTDFINCCAALLVLAAVWPVTRRFGAAYGVFLALNLAVPIASGTMLSLARLTATMFPIFLWLADAVPATRRTPLIAAFATIQGFAAVMFFTWRWLY
jgi:hypothetical protein